jgi:hypothetical protein
MSMRKFSTQVLSSLALVISPAYVSAQAAPSVTQTVPQSVYSFNAKQQELCGLTAANAGGFQSQVVASGTTRINAPGRFIVYESKTAGPDPDVRIWYFTKPSDVAHPTAICRADIRDASGVHQRTDSMDCGAPKKVCDQLYLTLFAQRSKP